MKNIKRIIKVLFPNIYFFLILAKVKKEYALVKDKKVFSEEKYFKEYGMRFNLDNPKTFYEKVCFLKLFYDETDPEKLVDKVIVKSYLKEKGFENHTARLIDSFSSFSEFKKGIKNVIEENDQFVIKLNHTSGDVFFYKDSHWRDKEGNTTSKRYIFACLKHKIKLSYYTINFEKPYLKIKPQIFIEEYLSSFNDGGLDEFKFFLNKGEIKMINVIYGRQKGDDIKEAFTDKELRLLGAHQNVPTLTQDEIYRPKCFDKMIEFCKKTVSDRLLIRVDLMTNGESFYFCEFTFYDCAGFNIFYPLDFNYKIGNLFDISDITNL